MDSMMFWVGILILEFVLIGIILFKISEKIKEDNSFGFAEKEEDRSKPFIITPASKITIEEIEMLNSTREIHRLFTELNELDEQVFMLELDMLLVSLSIKSTSAYKNDWYMRLDNFKTDEEYKRALVSRMNYVKVRYLMKFLELINHPIQEGNISQRKMISGFWEERDLLHSFQSVVGIPLACYIHLLIDGSDDFTL